MQDGHGNFTRRTLNGVNTYFGYDVHNKLLWVNTTNVAPTTGQASPYRKYTYNANGEPTTIERRDTTASPVVTDTLEWDGMGKLRKVVSGGTTVYTATYDGAGDRVQATLNGTAHTYSYGAGLLYDSAGTTVYTPGVSHCQSGIDSYYHEDWIASTRYTTDATGLTAPAAQRWDAYGNLTASAGGHGGALRWVGGHGYESDAPLGLNLLGARYYDPAVGRFLNADPIGIAGGINQFNYCGGDPVNRIDPRGLDWLSDIFGGPLSEDEEAVLRIAVATGTTVGSVIGGATGGTGGFILGGVGGAGVGAIPGTAAGVGLGVAAGAFEGGVFGGAIGLAGVFGARALKALAGSLATLSATKGGGAPCDKGPYDQIDPDFAGKPGADFTRTQKRKYKAENRRRNEGKLLDDESGEELVETKKSVKGVTPPRNEVQIDHYHPKSKGGPNASWNARVRARWANREKSDR
jgi:RHS repeat-associated protein